MKKPIKSIVTSSLLAVAFGALSVGSTFALFTSQAKTEINVGAGEVRVGQTLEVQSVSELGNVAVTPIGGVYTNSIGGKTYIDSEDANLLHLENWVPGDKAIIKVTNNNYSNVTIKTRFTVSHTSTSTPDLYDALTLNYLAKDADDNDIGYKFMDWSPVEPSVSKISDVYVTIEFPDHDNGEILFGDANQDNQYQNCNCSIMFTQEAVQGNAHTDSILDQLNAALDTAAATNGRNKTMYDALQDVSSVLEEPSIKTAGYVWNTSTDHFYFGQENVTNEYFKIYDEMPGTQTNSIYASSSWNTATVDLTGVGFDAGSASGITAVNYVGLDSASTNVIRTNSAATSVNVDAPQDTISHYGTAGSLNINAIAGNSYHEHGKVVFAEIRKGRIALEKGADVTKIHVNAKLDDQQQKLDEFEEIIIARDESVAMPTLSRDDVEIASQGTLVVALQEGTETVTEQTELDYVWLTKQGIYEQITVSDSSESAGNTWVNTSDKSAETKEAAQQIANNIGRDSNGDVNEVVTVSDQEYTVTLDEETREIIVTDSNNEVVADTEVIAAATEGAVVERGMTEEEKEAAKEEIVDEAIIDEIEEDDRYVARIGTTPYESLKDAVASAVANDVIEMTANDLSTENVSVDKVLTIRMNEKTFGGTIVVATTGTNAVTVVGQANVDAIIKFGNRYFNSFVSANNATIVLLKDITLTNINVGPNSNYTYDLNGHTITLTKSDSSQGAIYLQNNYQEYAGARLTVKDGNLNFTGTGFSSVGIFAYGELNLSNVNITSTCENAIETQPDAYCGKGIVNINGGSITTARKAIYALAANDKFPTISLNGVEIIETGSDTPLLAYGAVMEITDCVVRTSSSEPVLKVGHSAIGGSPSQVTINSGTFDGSISKEEGHFLFIKGGNFKSNPTALVNTSVYDINLNDGYYVVSLNEANVACSIDGIYYSSIEQAILDRPNDGKTIVLLKNSSEEIVVQQMADFQIDENGYSFTGSISAGEGYNMTVVNGHYMITPPPQARIGSNDYLTLGEAIKAILKGQEASGASITLLNDTDVETVQISKPSSAKTFTIVTNGFAINTTLKAPNGWSYIYIIENGSYHSISNGSTYSLASLGDVEVRIQ